jgi:hypothetical protein
VHILRYSSRIRDYRHRGGTLADDKLSAGEEDIMIKLLITATLFVVGGAGIGVVGYLATEPLAFTRNVPAPASMVAERPPTVVPVSVPVTREAAPNSIWLHEVRITAAAPKAAKQSVVPGRYDPCSEWRDVGVLFVDPAGATGVRNVRALCAHTGDER